MSALFDTTSKWLAATLGAEAPTVDEYKLMTAWIFLPTGATGAGVSDWAFALENSDGAYGKVGVGTGPRTKALGKHAGGGGSAFLDLTAASLDTWYSVGILCGIDNGTNQTVRSYQNGATDNFQSQATTNLDTADWDIVTVGNDKEHDSADNFNGRVEDAAVYIVYGSSQAETIMSQIYNTGSPVRANAILEKTPAWYDSLTSGINSEIGAVLTNTGSVTFDDTISPFGAPGGGGETSQASSLFFSL